MRDALQQQRLPRLTQQMAAVVRRAAVDAEGHGHAAIEHRAHGAIPDARRMLELGQCATPVRVEANSAIPRPSSFTQCACHACGPVQPSESA